MSILALYSKCTRALNFRICAKVWSWRGTGAITDKYHAKGMRIDYTLVSKSLRAHVLESTIIGRGIDRREGFFGSDHSPIFLRMSPLDTEPPAAAGPAPALSDTVLGLF